MGTEDLPYDAGGGDVPNVEKDDARRSVNDAEQSEYADEAREILERLRQGDHDAKDRCSNIGRQTQKDIRDALQQVRDAVLERDLKADDNFEADRVLGQLENELQKLAPDSVRAELQGWMRFFQGISKSLLDEMAEYYNENNGRLERLTQELLRSRDDLLRSKVVLRDYQERIEEHRTELQDVVERAMCWHEILKQAIDEGSEPRAVQRGYERLTRRVDALLSLLQGVMQCEIALKITLENNARLCDTINDALTINRGLNSVSQILSQHQPMPNKAQWREMLEDIDFDGDMNPERLFQTCESMFNRAQKLVQDAFSQKDKAQEAIEATEDAAAIESQADDT